MGIERVLVRAGRDSAFLEELGARGASAADSAGIELTQAERTILDTIGAERIAAMVTSLPKALHAQPAEESPFVSHGIRPYPEPTRGTRPEKLVSAGVRPGPDPTRGSRPGLKVAVAAGAVLTVAAGGMLLATAGNRPEELPPPTEPEDRGDDDPSGAGGSDPDAGSDAGSNR